MLIQNSISVGHGGCRPHWPAKGYLENDFFHLKDQIV